MLFPAVMLHMCLRMKLPTIQRSTKPGKDVSLASAAKPKSMNNRCCNNCECTFPLRIRKIYDHLDNSTESIESTNKEREARYTFFTIVVEMSQRPFKLCLILLVNTFLVQYLDNSRTDNLQLQERYSYCIVTESLKVQYTEIQNRG